MSSSPLLFGPGHILYPRMAVFQREASAGLDCDMTKPGSYGDLHSARDDRKFWWHVFSGVLATAMLQAGYDDRLRKRFLDVYCHTLPLLGPRPFASGKAQRFSPFGYDNTPIELSHAYDGYKSTIRFACDHHNPPGDTFAQEITKAVLSDIGNQFAQDTADSQIFDAIAHKMFIDPANRDELVQEWLPADTSEPRPIHLASGFDLHLDGSITIKVYVTTLIKSLEVRKSPNEVATELIQWLDHCIYSATPLLPGYRLVEDYTRSLPPQATQHVWQFGWDYVSPIASRLKVYLWMAKTSLAGIRGMWTQGGRLTGPEINKGLELIDELWPILYDGHSKLLPEDELRNYSGESQPIILNLEFKPGEKSPAPKIYFQPAKFATSDQDVAKSLAGWFKARGWPIHNTWVSDTIHLL